MARLPQITPSAVKRTIAERRAIRQAPVLSLTRQPRAIAPIGCRRRWRAATTHNSQAAGDRLSLLGLPAELREAIYKYVVDTSTWITDKNDPASLAVAPHLPSAAGYRARPHPLAQIFQLIRTEFTYYTAQTLRRKQSSGSNQWYVYVNDFNFQPLINHLEQTVPYIRPCQLRITLGFTVPGKENWHGLMLLINFWMLQRERRQYCFMFRHDSRTEGVDSQGRFRSSVVAEFYRNMQSKNVQTAQTIAPLVSAILGALSSWIVNIGTDEEKVERLLWKVSSFARMPKRLRQPQLRQNKRRRLGDKGEWQMQEGFDKYGDEDEEYLKLLEAMKGLSL